MHNSALFLDRDGVINVDRGYIHRSDQFEFVPGIFDLARFWTNELQRPIVVVTNQSGIGRGYFDENTYADLTRWMCDRFEAERTAITRVYHCPYHPLDAIGEYRCDHPWRKPKPGMLLQAASDLGLDPVRCAILGDKMSDMEAGAAAGIGLRVLIGPRDAKTGEPPYEVVADLGEALALFRSRFAPTAPDQRSGDRSSAIQCSNFTCRRPMEPPCRCLPSADGASCSIKRKMPRALLRAMIVQYRTAMTVGPHHPRPPA